MEAVYSKCVSECGDLLKEELQATRPLGPTLVSAVTIFALYLAANWEMALLTDFPGNWITRAILHGMLIFAVPVYPFISNIQATFAVWLLKRKLCKKGVTSYKGWKSVAIMVCCPIFIQIPPHTQPIQGVGVDDDDWDRRESYVQKYCPLDLPPRLVQGVARSLSHSLLQRADLEAPPSPPPASPGSTARDTNPPTQDTNPPSEAAPDTTQDTNPPSEAAPDTAQDTNPPSAAATDTTQDTNPPVQDTNPPSGPAKDTNSLARDTNPPSAATQDTSLPAANAQQPCNEERKYLLIESNDEVALPREVLLELGFAPGYEQLRFLRSRSTFQTVVTALQALGYLLGVLVRRVEDLAISPLEIILGYLCLLVVLQLVMEFYACTHFQRPLLLRLNAEQFAQFYDELMSRSHSANPPAKNPWPMRVSALVYNVVAGPFVYFVISNSGSDCLLCLVSTNLFFNVPILFLVVYILTKVAAYAITIVARPQKSWLCKYVAMLITALESITGIVIALVATCLNWNANFNRATSYRMVVNWLVAHVSSN